MTFHDQYGPFQLNRSGLSLLGSALSLDTSLLGRYERNLIPTETERGNSASHRSSIESALVGSNVIRFFQTGSFKFGTGLKGLSDVDYFLCLRQEFPFPKLLEEIRGILAAKFPATTVKIDSPGVLVDFSTKPKYEIIPAIFLYKIRTQYGDHDVFKIAAGNGHKITCPEFYNDMIDYENRRLNEKLKPLIRLLKAWNKYNGLGITSFYIEMYVTMHCKNLTTINLGTEMENIALQFSSYGFQPIGDPLGVENFYPGFSNPFMHAAAQSIAKADYGSIYVANRSLETAAIPLWGRVFKGNFSA